MLLHFRQGIVEAQIPTFIQVTYPHVDLIVTDTNCTIAFAAGQKDYLFTEQQSVAKAWGPLHLGVDQWLYWDLDIRTGNRTFGITKVAPINSPTQPASPAMDQHWFNTLTNEMKVWTGAAWVKRIRAFACKLAQGRIPVSMSANAPLFTGTQVGNNTTTYVGHILYDATTGNAIRDASGNFMTTEDNLSTKTISLSQVKVASIIVEGVAQQNMAAHTIVRFTDFGKIVHADQFIANQPIQYGIIEQSVTVGQTVNVVTNGMVSSESFDFTDVGVNALLYCDAAGQLVSAPVIPGQVPVAVVVDRKTIQLGVALASNNETIPEVNLATNLAFGISRLSVPAEDESDPIVVGDNDPRWNSFVRKAGDSMSGPLFLNGAPTLDLHAATKKYVDDSRTPAAGNTFEVQYNINGEFAASDSLKLWLPDENYNGMSLNVGSSDHVSATITTNAWAGNIQIEGGGRQDGQPGSAILQGGVLYTTTTPENGPGTIFGGHAMVTGGPASGEFGRAGDAWMQGGSGDWINGRALVHGGTNYNVDLGYSTANGGNVQIDGGAAQGELCPYNGGSVIIRGGRAEGTGTPGNIELHTSDVVRLGIMHTGAWAVGPTQNTGTDGQVLTSRGPSSDPEWVTPSSGSGLEDRIVSGNVTLLVNNESQHSQLSVGDVIVSQSNPQQTTFFGDLESFWVSTVPLYVDDKLAANFITTNTSGEVATLLRNTDTSYMYTLLTKHSASGAKLWSYVISTETEPGWPGDMVGLVPVGIFNIDDVLMLIVHSSPGNGVVIEKRRWSDGVLVGTMKLAPTVDIDPSWTGHMRAANTDESGTVLALVGSTSEANGHVLIKVNVPDLTLISTNTLNITATPQYETKFYSNAVEFDSLHNIYITSAATNTYSDTHTWAITKVSSSGSVMWSVYRQSDYYTKYDASDVVVDGNRVLVVGTVSQNDPYAGVQVSNINLLILDAATGQLVADKIISDGNPRTGGSLLVTPEHYIVTSDTKASVRGQSHNVTVTHLLKADLSIVQSTILVVNVVTMSDVDYGSRQYTSNIITSNGAQLFIVLSGSTPGDIEA